VASYGFYGVLNKAVLNAYILLLKNTNRKTPWNGGCFRRNWQWIWSSVWL